MKQKHTFLQILVLLLVCLCLASNCPAQDVIEVVDIGSFQVKVIRERVGFGTQFIEVVMPTEQYGLENLKQIWVYYCTKYSDKKVRLDLRVFTVATFEYNKQFEGKFTAGGWDDMPKAGSTEPRPRSYEASFQRMGDGALAYGGENELLIYCPDPNKPREIVRLVLAGKDPYNR